MNPFSEDEEEQQEKFIGLPDKEEPKAEPAAPDVREYLSKKYGLGADMGPPVTEASVEAQYKRAANDRSGVDKAERRERFTRFGGAALMGLGAILAPKHTDVKAYEGALARADKDVQRAEGKRQQGMQEVLTANKAKREVIANQREDQEHGDLNDPKSNKSKLAGNLSASKALQLSKDAAEAGDKENSQRFKELAGELTKGTYSASEIGKMELLGDVSYKDILNNKAAMARIQAQGKQDDRRAEHQRDGENRRIDAKKRETEDKMRAILKEPVMKQAAMGRIAFQKFNDTIDLNTPAGAEAALMMWQKGLDPLSVVRETEFARTPGMQGYLTQAEAAFNKATGAGAMTPEMATQLKQAMDKLQGAYNDYARSQLSVIDSNVQTYGLNESNIYGDFHKNLAGDKAAPTAPAVNDKQVSPPPPAAGEIERLDPKSGKTAVYDSQTKAFIRWK